MYLLIYMKILLYRSVLFYAALTEIVFGPIERGMTEGWTQSWWHVRGLEL